MHSKPEIAALLEISEHLSKSKDLKSVLLTIKEVATRLMEADRASIFLKDTTSGESWAYLADGVQEIRVPSGQGIVGRVIEKNQSILVEDAKKDERHYPQTDAATGYRTRNILCTPMRNRTGKAVGAIQVLNKREGNFSRQDENLLVILGTQAAIAVENVEMYLDIQENVKNLTLLTRLQAESSLLFNVEDVFRLILEECTEHLELDRGAIFVRRIQAQSMLYCYERYAGRESFEISADEAVASSLTFRLDPETLSRLDDRARSTALFADRGYTVAPIKTGEELRGHLILPSSAAEDRLFNPRHMEFLQIVAGLVANALEKHQLLQDKSRAEKMSVLGSMVGNLIHDIRNPLGGVSGYAQLIFQQTEDPAIQQFAGAIMQELDRLEKMNHEVLAFARGDRVEPVREPVNVSNLLGGMIRLLSNTFGGKKIQPRMEVPEDLVIHVDETKLLRVLHNIARNGCEAMKNGGALTLSCVQEEPNGCVIVVRDTGEGMPENVRRRIFEPFFTHGKENGTGLGMAIVKNIVDSFGGTIDVESIQGQGTTFRISLPDVIP